MTPSGSLWQQIGPCRCVGLDTISLLFYSESFFWHSYSVFNKSFPIWCNDSKMGLRNRKRNYLNRLWNNFFLVQSSVQKSFPFGHTISKCFSETGNKIIVYANNVGTWVWIVSGKCTMLHARHFRELQQTGHFRVSYGQRLKCCSFWNTWPI